MKITKTVSVDAEAWNKCLELGGVNSHICNDALIAYSKTDRTPGNVDFAKEVRAVEIKVQADELKKYADAIAKGKKKLGKLINSKGFYTALRESRQAFPKWSTSPETNLKRIEWAISQVEKVPPAPPPKDKNVYIKPGMAPEEITKGNLDPQKKKKPKSLHKKGAK